MGFRSWIAGIVGRFSSTPAPAILSGSGSLQPMLYADFRLTPCTDDMEDYRLSFYPPDTVAFPALLPLTDFFVEDGS